MIANIEDINSALSTIRTENNIYPMAVTDKMDSASFNASCECIEQQLNGLYEKIRLIEDMDNFCREYVLQKILEKEEKLRESLKITEDAVDLYLNKDSISVLVPFTSTSDAIRDRDGSTIGKMKVKNKKLEAVSDVMADAPISNVIYTSNASCYNNSYQNLVNGEPGTSYYSIPEPPLAGVQEDVTVYLTRPTECNYVSIHPVNCNITNVRILDESKNETVINPNGYFKKTTILGITFKLRAKNCVREAKLVSVDGYSNYGAFGMTDLAYDRWQNEQTIKRMEISQEEMDRKYIISSLETKCDTWERINKKARRRNILIAGGSN